MRLKKSLTASLRSLTQPAQDVVQDRLANDDLEDVECQSAEEVPFGRDRQREKHWPATCDCVQKDDNVLKNNESTNRGTRECLRVRAKVVLRRQIGYISPTVLWRHLRQSLFSLRAFAFNVNIRLMLRDGGVKHFEGVHSACSFGTTRVTAKTSSVSVWTSARDSHNCLELCQTR